MIKYNGQLQCKAAKANGTKTKNLVNDAIETVKCWYLPESATLQINLDVGIRATHFGVINKMSYIICIWIRASNLIKKKLLHWSGGSVDE